MNHESEEVTIACTHEFWHEFYRALGVTLGGIIPSIGLFGVIFLSAFRLIWRHEERMAEIRQTEYHRSYQILRGRQGGR
jgi:hypothetical protein